MINPGKLMGLRRLGDAGGRFKMLAVDQRPPIERLVAEGRGSPEHDRDDVARLKTVLIEELGEHASALLLDPQYAFPSALPLLPHGKGLLITLEDDRFEEAPGGRRSAPIGDWSVRKIKMSGGDAVKVLAWYRPDASADVKEHQEHFVAEVGAQCAEHDIPFVLELLVYPLRSEAGHTTDYVEHPAKRADDVIASVAHFARPRFGVDLFKLESPLPASSLAEDPSRANDAFARLGSAAGRPWVVLSAGADQETFRLVLEHALDAGASGFLAGRAIWWEACRRAFPDWDGVVAGIRDTSVPYMMELSELTDARARPWHQHPSFGPGGPQPPPTGAAFRSVYGEEGE